MTMDYLGSKTTFVTGYSKTAHRPGDLYVKRTNGGWELNAGVDCFGHDPGFGVWCKIDDGSKEARDHEAFLLETRRIQEFLADEFGMDSVATAQVIERIWCYISGQI